jgi:hypothetical protein
MNAIETARAFGKKAFHDGKKRIPAHDAELMKLIGETSTGIGSSLPLLNAWLKAWDVENLKGEF